MKVLITGAAGFIGRPCLAALRQQGDDVCAVSSRVHAPDEVEWRQVDLFDEAGVRDLIASVRPTHLLHMAWITTPGRYWTSPANLDWVRASLQLLRQFQACGGERVVMAGTCAEYEWGHARCVEGVTPLKPATLYGTCKHGLQLVCEAFSRETGLSSAWGRIFFTYGPYEHPARLVPGVVEALLARQTADCSAGTQVRDFLFVDDVARAFVALLKSPVTGPVNIASGVPVTIRTVVSELAALLDGTDLVRFGSREIAPGDPEVLVGGVDRLTNEVGWQPGFTLAEGLDATIRWHRDPAASITRRP
jgi:nucleoside-diphosphate-sugar epimerase